MPTKTCPNCKKEFHYYKSSPKEHCSRQCQKEAARIWTNCPRCDKHFWYHRSWPRIYCSRKCSSAINAKKNLGIIETGFEKITCDFCGKPFERRQNVIEKTTNHFCSQKCFGFWLSANNTGDNHPLFNGGAEPYYGVNWSIQRRLARKRDNYTCQRCGITQKELGRALDVHHIIPFREFGIERYKEANHLSNLVSFCNVCHKYAEHHPEVLI